MRVTSKGQVTIPIDIREKAGILPNMDVEFEIIKDKVKMTTDEIMALTREE